MHEGALKTEFLETIPNVNDEYVLVPARGGSWIRNLIPGLWGSSPRVVAISQHEVLLIAATFGFLKLKNVLWRGAHQDITFRRYFGDRVIRLRFPGSPLRRRAQIDGKDACQSALAAFDLAEGA